VSGSTGFASARFHSAGSSTSDGALTREGILTGENGQAAAPGPPNSLRHIPSLPVGTRQD